MRWTVVRVAAALCGAGLGACAGGGAGGGSGGSDAAEVTTTMTLPAAMRGGGATEPDVPDANDAPDAARPDGSPFGARCGQVDECDSNVCADHRCSLACDPDDAHACREALGLCARVRYDRHACTGDVASGADGDDALLRPGDAVSASAAAPGDVDVFRLAVPPGAWRVVVTPAADVDLALDFHDAHARLVGTSDDGVASAAESATWTASDDEGAFAVVRHVGGAPGAYTVRLEAVRR